MNDPEELNEILQRLNEIAQGSNAKVKTVDLSKEPPALAEFIAHLHTHLDDIHEKVENIVSSQAIMVAEMTAIREGQASSAKLFMQYYEKVLTLEKHFTKVTKK